MSDHPIADVSYTDSPNWICCLCGWESEAANPDEINAVYRAHRASKGAERVVLSDSKHHRGSAFTIKAKHQQVDPDDQTIDYLMTASPL